MAPQRHDAAKRLRAPGAGRPRKTPRTSDRPVPEEILGEAARLFARQGVTATTMAEIADASGLQISSLYYYFGSKHEMLERMVADVNRVPLAALDRAVAAHDSAAGALHAFIRADASALCDFPFDINELHRLAGEESAIFGRYWDERQALNDRVEDLIATGIAAGELVDVDPHLTALTVLANDEAVQNWYRPVGSRRLAGRGGDDAGSYTPAVIGDYLADLALRSLLADPSRLDEIRSATP